MNTATRLSLFFLFLSISPVFAGENQPNSVRPKRVRPAPINIPSRSDCEKSKKESKIVTPPTSPIASQDSQPHRTPENSASATYNSRDVSKYIAAQIAALPENPHNRESRTLSVCEHCYYWSYGCGIGGLAGFLAVAGGLSHGESVTGEHLPHPYDGMLLLGGIAAGGLTGAITAVEYAQSKKAREFNSDNERTSRYQQQVENIVHNTLTKYKQD